MNDVTNWAGIFGPEAYGATEAELAATSKNVYVRSQVQLALATPNATGRRLSALEALDSFGIVALREVADEGYSPIVTTRTEPANTLRRRREALNLPPKEIARRLGLELDVVKAAETPGKVSKIRDLEKIAISLALDERMIGLKASAGGDEGLGVRLRELQREIDEMRFSASSVVSLAEAGWIIARQSELQRRLQVSAHSVITHGSLRSDDYSYKAAERGYELAANFRAALGLSEYEPVKSVRDILEDVLGVPLIQDQLTRRFAGATVANGDARGIVINETGLNEKVWVRRMTLAHEIGHLIGDPDPRLNKLKVDLYDQIINGAEHSVDNVERRANGFAVAFLAPPKAVNELSYSAIDDRDLLESVINQFGISRTAAIFHIRNITKRDVSAVKPNEIEDTSEEWLPNENRTLDYFPILSTPLNRRGKFASLVVQAEKAGHISSDTASIWLNATVDEYTQKRDVVLELQA